MSDTARLATAAACTLLWVLLVAITIWRHRRRAEVKAAPGAVLIAYASQTGTAEAIAIATGQALSQSGREVAVRSFAHLTPADLAGAREALFVAATTGEGDAPDDAANFLRDWSRAPAALPDLSYALLALGDRHYRHFCAFGHLLDQLLHDAGAKPLADTIEVDQGDAGAMRHWQQNLRLFGASPLPADWEAPKYMRWQLAERELVNPGSPGAPMYRLRLTPGEAMPQWAAGDIAEIYPGPAAEGRASAPPLSHRDYSIATIPEEGGVGLLVRLFRDDEGRVGLGSGWLCERAEPGGEVALRIRANPRFHTPSPDVPMILIGNGTGLAGLRAHLRARPDGTRNWLIFGERHPEFDRPMGAELDGWAGGHARIDRIFSRGEAGGPRYVQNALTLHADALRQWLAEGAAIYLCGSLVMGAAIDAGLRALLGAEAVDALQAADRYRRDIY